MPTALVASGLALISCSAFGQLQVDKGTADHPLAHSPSLSQTGFVIKGKQLSLSQAVNICLATSRLLVAAKANLYIFQGRTSEAYAALNPTLTGNLPGNYLNWFARKGFPPGEIGLLLALMHELDHNGLAALLDPLRKDLSKLSQSK